MGAKMNSGFNVDATGRNLPFFGLRDARKFDHQPGSAEALHLSGMDYVVGKRPAFQQNYAGEFVEIPGKFVTYRTDTEAAFGVVGNQYQPFNNEPAFALVDELLGFGASIAAAGTWDNGANVFVTAHLPEGIKVAGEEDLDLYLLFRNNHAGTGSVSCYITPVRLACTNQLGSAILQAVSSWKVRHTATVSSRVAEAAATMNLVDTYKEAMESTVKFLQETEISMDEVDAFLKELTDAKRVQESIKEVYNTSETVTQGNRWGLFNAVTEQLDWYPARKTGPETRFASQLDGPISRCRQQAMNLLIRR